MNLQYEFEPMGKGNYQVRLCGEFIAYTNHTDEKEVDQYLKELGYNSREHFFNANTCDNLIDYLYFFYEKAGINIPEHFSFEPSTSGKHIVLWNDKTEEAILVTESPNLMIDYIYNNQLFEDYHK